MKQNNDFKIGDRVRVLPWNKLVKECLIPKPEPGTLSDATVPLMRLSALAGADALVHRIEGDVLTLTDFSCPRYKECYIFCDKRFCEKVEVPNA